MILCHVCCCKTKPQCHEIKGFRIVRQICASSTCPCRGPKTPNIRAEEISWSRRGSSVFVEWRGRLPRHSITGSLEKFLSNCVSISKFLFFCDYFFAFLLVFSVLNNGINVTWLTGVPSNFLWCKKCDVTHGGPQLTSFDAKNITWLTGAPTDLLWCKNVT